MVAHFTMRTYGVNQAFRFFSGIWYMERVIKPDFFSRNRPILYYTCATCSELPSYIKTMI